jgi:hypothetical protein
MKQSMLIVLLLLCVGCLFSFEPSALNLEVPSNLEGNSSVFELQHRFYGNLTEDPLENFFGLDVGANVNLGLRYAVLDRLELYAAYTRFEKEYRVAASYAHHFPQLYTRTQIDVEFFSFRMGGERNQNVYYGLVLQSEPVFNTVIATADLGYDGYHEKLGLGLGLDVGFDWEFGPIEHVSFIGEYYPLLQREVPITGSENCFAAGIRIDTYGHQFILLVGNSWQIGNRRLMLGAPSNDVRFGLNVHRLFIF